MLTGQLMQGLLEQLKLEIGLNGSVLQQSHHDFGILATESWMQ